MTSTPRKTSRRLNTSEDIRWEFNNITMSDFEDSNDDVDDDDDDDDDDDGDDHDDERSDEGDIVGASEDESESDTASQLELDDVVEEYETGGRGNDDSSSSSENESESEREKEVTTRTRSRARARSRRPRSRRRGRRQGADSGTANFAWSDKTQNYDPRQFDFDGQNAGITEDFPVTDEEQDKEMNYFLAFFDSEIMDFLAARTNMFYIWHTQRAANRPTPRRGHMANYHDTSVQELYVFFALMMLMPHIRKHVLKDYWATGNLTATPSFGKYMTRDRFTSLMRYLHFADNNNPNGQDRLWKVRKPFEMLKER